MNRDDMAEVACEVGDVGLLECLIKGNVLRRYADISNLKDLITTLDTLLMLTRHGYIPSTYDLHRAVLLNNHEMVTYLVDALHLQRPSTLNTNLFIYFVDNLGYKITNDDLTDAISNNSELAEKLIARLANEEIEEEGGRGRG